MCIFVFLYFLYDVLCMYVMIMCEEGHPKPKSGICTVFVELAFSLS